jgi:hypothetical protein
MEENDIADWDVVYDARGHFTEPHDNGVATVLKRTEPLKEYLASDKPLTNHQNAFP